MLIALLAALAVNSSTVTASSGATTATATTGYSFTNTAGTLLVVCAEASSQSGANTNVSAVTYGGAAMTLAAGATAKKQWDTTASVASLWFLLSPLTGANTVSITATTTGTFVGWISGAISFTGNDVTTPIRATAFSASSAVANTTATVAVTGTTSGNIIVDCMGTGTSATSATAPSTNIWLKNVNGNSAGNNAASSRSAGTGGSVTMAYTVASDLWGTVAIEVQAAGGAPAGPVESGMRGFWGVRVPRDIWRKEERC